MKATKQTKTKPVTLCPACQVDGVKRYVISQGFPGHMRHMHKEWTRTAHGWTGPKSVQGVEAASPVVEKQEPAIHILRDENGTRVNPGELVTQAYQRVISARELLNEAERNYREAVDLARIAI